MFDQLTIKQYNDILASKSPTPGGGSALAQVGATACSLVAMAINVTCAKAKQQDENYDYLQRELAFCLRAQNKLYQLSNDDAKAFDDIIGALKMPKETDEQKKQRLALLQKCYHKGALVPLDVMETCFVACQHAVKRVFALLDKYVSSDCTIAIELMRTVMRCCVDNVEVNAKCITDEQLQRQLLSKAQNLLNDADLQFVGYKQK